MLNKYPELKAAMLEANRAYAKVCKRCGNEHAKSLAAEAIAKKASSEFWSAVKGAH